jgi:hypothetical protein
VLTPFLLSHLQTALTAITMTRNAIAPPAKTIATANEVIVGIGIGTERGIGIGIVGGEKERSAAATLTTTGSAQTAATATGTVTGTVTVVAIARKDAPATRKNAGETSRAKMIDAAHSAAKTREALLAEPAAAAAANVTVARQSAAHQHLWAPSRCRSANARRAAGTFTRQATSNTRPCRRNKRVRIAYLLE